MTCHATMLMVTYSITVDKIQMASYLVTKGVDNEWIVVAGAIFHIVGCYYHRCYYVSKIYALTMKFHTSQPQSSENTSLNKWAFGGHFGQKEVY